MKRLLSLLVLTCWVATLGALALPAIDNFTGISSDPLSGNWTTIAGSFDQGGGGTARSSFGGGAVSNAYWNADAFGNDQYAQAAITIGGGGVAGPSVRVSNAGGVNRYSYLSYGSGTYLSKVVAGGSEVVLIDYGGTPAFTNGDLLRIEVSGTTITAKLNGSTVGTQSDASLSSGSGGMMSYLAGGTLQTFEAGNLAGGGGGPPCTTLLLLRVGCH